MINDKSNRPYSRGVDAGWRTGEYDGIDKVPESPYEKGSHNDSEWQRGFTDGTEDCLEALRSYP